MRPRLGITLSLALALAGCGAPPTHDYYTTPGPTGPTGHEWAGGDIAGDAENTGDSGALGGDRTGPNWEGPRIGDSDRPGDSRPHGDSPALGDARSGGDRTWYGDSGYGGDRSAYGDPRPYGDASHGGDSANVSGDVWLQIDYSRRSAGESGSSADWSYSATPGFGEAQWAPQGSSWPYINTPDGGALVSDPIGGTVLELGCYDRLRIFFGLEELSSVSSATVEVEGRSRATSASVDFEVWNPGASSSEVWTGSMSNDWTADVVVVPFTAEAGDGFQAVEIAPVARSCALAIRRVRVTLNGID